MKIFQRVQEIWSKQERDRWPSIVTLTLSLHWWVISSTHHLIKANIWLNLTRQSEWQWSCLKIQGSNWWPSFVTLTLSRHSWVMGSAHHLTEANIWPTFKENHSRGKGEMERTLNSRLKHTFNRDLDLKSTGLWVLDIVPLRWTFDQSLEKILPGVKEIQSVHKIEGSNLWPCESAWLSYWLCTSFPWGKHLTKIKRKSFHR